LDYLKNIRGGKRKDRCSHKNSNINIATNAKSTTEYGNTAKQMIETPILPIGKAIYSKIFQHRHVGTTIGKDGEKFGLQNGSLPPTISGPCTPYMLLGIA
jgi:hypothetical protein